MAQQPKVYLDDEGNPLGTSTGTYLDEQGNAVDQSDWQGPRLPTEAAATPRRAAPRATSTTDTIADLLPILGGTVGSMVGKVPILRAITSGVGGAAGEGYRQLLKHGAEIPGALADVARNLIAEPRATVGGALEGMGAGVNEAVKQGAEQAGAELIGQGVTKAAGKVGRAVYRGYLKPSLSKQLLPRADEIVETAVKEYLPITRGAVEKGQRIIGELKDEVEGILQSSEGMLDVKGVADKVRAFARRKYYKPGTDLTDFNAAMAVADKIDAHPTLMVKGPEVATRVESPILTAEGQKQFTRKMVPGPDVADTRVSMQRANEIKRGLDTSITDAQFGVTSGAKKSAEKFGRAKLKLAMEAVEESIGPLNDRERRLIDTTKAIARGVAREANQNQLYGVKTIGAIAVGGGAAATGQDPATSTALAMASRIGMHPAIASRIALTAARLSKELGIGAASAARLAIYGTMESDAEPPPGLVPIKQP